MNKLFKELLKELNVKNLIYCVLGAFLIGFGVGFWNCIKLGYDPVNVFYHALVVTFGISLSQANLICGSLFLISTIFIDYKQLGIGTVINVFMMSVGVGVGTYVFKDLNYDVNMLILILYHIIGMVILCFGATLVVASKLGKSQYDAFIFGICARLKKPFTLVRYTSDTLFLLAGIALGGIFGIGTFIAWFGIAPVMAFFLKVIK